MAYKNGATYWICPVDNTGVALSVRGDSQVSQNRDVFLYTKEDIGDQLWRVDVGNGFARIKSTLDDRYALNIYLSTGNCDIHTWQDNQEDSKINFRTIIADDNIYKIQNYRNNADNDLYLTASKAASGGLVTWNASNGSSLQQWKLIEKTGGSTTGTTGKIKIPIYLSQKSHPNDWFKGNGCAVTAGIMAAAYHDNTTYNIQSFDKDIKVGNTWIPLWTEGNGYSWYTPRGWQFQNDTIPATIPGDAETVAYIKTYIDRGIPPLCYCPGEDGHWMLAYDYTSGSTFDSIFIVDPADGKSKTLGAGMRLSCGGTSRGITRIEAAPSAH